MAEVPISKRASAAIKLHNIVIPTEAVSRQRDREVDASAVCSAVQSILVPLL
jgi:post-segregation antitoxin (ccd killing protein)